MHNWYHSNISGILYVHGHELQFTTIHGALPLLLLPLASSPFLPFVHPFYLLGTLLAVTGSIHLGLRLLVNWPPLSHPLRKPSPLQIPRTPTAQRLTKTTSGIIRRLLSGTVNKILCHEVLVNRIISHRRVVNRILFHRVFVKKILFSQTICK